jgi:hypothetical protein
MFPLSRLIATLSVLLLIVMNSFPALAQEDDQKAAASPLRLSYVEGDISFSRLGAEDWVEAQINTPLAAGDALYVGRDGNLELQMGGRAFIRADDDTQLTLVNQTADFVQFKITSGRVSFDLRTLPTGFSVELDTPNAVFTIDRPGYYRADVNGDVHFITRRGGRAMMVPAGGQAMSIHPSEEIVVQGGTVAQAKTYVAPELDQWDRWNYERTEGLVDAVSERYLPSGIAGASDLDHYGRWRVVPEYGPVWVPDAVSPGWAPYSTGRWVWDPYYQWTWIDDAPWGWAPFHYGRWIHLGVYWAWTPGPVVRHTVYAPALVAFFGISPQVSVGIGIGGSGVGWVALSWGEPLTPWWGQPGFVGRPWWGGWHGPRVVNNVTNITYHNTRVSNAVVATTREHFGRGHVRDAPVRVTQTRELERVRGALPVKPGPASLVAGVHRGVRPPESVLSRPVVSTRPPQESRLPWRTEDPKSEKKPGPEQRYVEMPKHPSNDLPRPEFGTQTGAERATPPLQPSFKEKRRDAEPAAAGNVIRERTQPDRAEPRAPRTSAPEAATPPRTVREIAPPRAVQEQERARATQEPRRGEAASGRTRPAPETTPQRERADLPGNPANRMYRGQDNKEGGDRRRSGQKSDN